jgi:hypothetical protein
LGAITKGQRQTGGQGLFRSDLGPVRSVNIKSFRGSCICQGVPNAAVTFSVERKSLAQILLTYVP